MDGKETTKNINMIHMILGMVFLVFFYGYFYSDILITTSHGINLWDILFSGRILDFHELCCSDVNNAAYTITAIYAGYDFPIYVLFAVWNFPLWVIKKSTGVNIWNSVLAMMWAKSIILLFIVLSVRSLGKLCDVMDIPERKKTVTAVFLTSSFISSCAVVNSQYDIITAFFMLQALSCYMNKKRNAFVVYIVIATMVKPFALFLFVPLLLYAEKNAVKLALHSLCVLIPCVGFKVLIPNHTQLTTAGTILTLFKNKISIAMAEIPIFFLVTFLFWILCYLYKAPDDKEQFFKNSALIAYLSLAIFFMLCACNPYWVIMLLPFQCVLIGLNRKYEFLGVILETVGSICLIGHYVIELPWCFDVRILRTSYFAKIFGLRADTTDNVLDIIHNFSETVYDMRDRGSGFLFGLFFTTSLAFIWLNLSKHKDIALEDRAIPGYIFAVRLGISLAVCLIPMSAYIF